MDIKLFTEMLQDKYFCNYNKLKHKYSDSFAEFLSVLSELYYNPLPLKDFHKNPIVFTEIHSSVNQSAFKLLLASQNGSYGLKAAAEEIIASSAIEKIDYDRDSVRNILKGYAPKDDQENRILGQKKGLEFISDLSNKISENNLFKLYMMTVGDFLPESDRLKPGKKYRHDSVYIVSNQVEHSGIDYNFLPEYMNRLIDFANAEDDMNDLVKAAIIHFYLSYIHPYFDGNGRIARLVHLWFLIQKGYRSALYIPFSSQIQKTRNDYYAAYTLIEQNSQYSGKIDVTPFIKYFIENVYNIISTCFAPVDVLTTYSDAVKKGLITDKETKLWQFVLSEYGEDEFSTKQLEKDFGNAAYATIRAFVLKFEKLELMESQKYGQRVKYKIAK